MPTQEDRTGLMSMGDEDLGERRSKFYQRILSSAQSSRTGAFQLICDAWQQFSGADISALWILNDYTGRWELVSCVTKDGRRFPGTQLEFGRDHVLDYCWLTKQPVQVSDFLNWGPSFNGAVYQCGDAQALMDAGLASMECVPLLHASSPVQGDSDEELQLSVSSIICQYFGNRVMIRVPSDKDWQLMSCLSASAIINAYCMEELQVAAELNSLAERYLTDDTSRPAVVRARYLEDLIHLISRHLHSEAVSIFYRLPVDDGIQCLATTGLQDRSGSIVKPQKNSSVIYWPGDSFMWNCFETGTPAIRDITSDPHERYFETGPDGEVSLREILLHPIRRHARNQPKTNLGSTGVIRCAYHIVPDLGNVTRPFDATDVEVLSLIAQHVKPVLETMERKVRRETTISIVKHDLYAPLNMIRDAASQIYDDLKRGVPIKGYDLQNIKTSSLTARHLVADLNPDPTRFAEFKPMSTDIDEEIVKRISASLNHFAAERQMSIVFRGFGDLPRVTLDSKLIERVLWNLITNAIKYGKDETTVLVVGTSLKNSVQIDVSNDGDGVERQELERVFTPYFRSVSARKKSQGLGLGLAIARGAVERHGGTLKLSSLKQPTTFSMRLPITPDPRATQLAKVNDALQTPRLPQPGETVMTVLLKEKTTKGGWKARHESTGLAGPIQNSSVVSQDAVAGLKTKLIVATAKPGNIAFRWPTADEKARSSKRGRNRKSKKKHRR